MTILTPYELGRKWGRQLIKEGKVEQGMRLIPAIIQIPVLGEEFAQGIVDVIA